MDVMLLLIVFLVAPVQAAAAGDAWTVVKHREGIVVSTRPVPGSPVDEFSGTALLTARLETVLAVLRDVAAQPRWMDRCRESRLIDEMSLRERLIYNVTALPWPLKDRDVVVRQGLTVDAQGRVHIAFSAIDGIVPPRPGTVRMRVLSGSWILESVDRGHTRVTYTIRTNPGGSLPSLMANYASRQIPLRTIVGLRRMAAAADYQERGAALRRQNDGIAREIAIARLKAHCANRGIDGARCARLLGDGDLVRQMIDGDTTGNDAVERLLQSPAAETPVPAASHEPTQSAILIDDFFCARPPR